AGRPLLQVAADNGNQLDLNMLHAAMPNVDVDKWVNDCASVAVLEIQDGRWHFVHDKLRAGLLSNLNADQLRNLHRQVAIAFEQTYPDTTSQAANLAYHWHEAQDTDKEGYYTALAGEQALRSGAYQTAAPYLERAVSLISQKHLGRSDRSEGRRRWAYLERQLAEAYYGAGELVKSRDYEVHALKLLGFPLPTARATLVAGIIRHGLTRSVRRALPFQPGQISPERQATMREAVSGYQQLIQVLYFSGEVLPFVYANLHGLNLAEGVGIATPAVRARAYVNMGISFGFIPLHRRAEMWTRWALENLKEVDDPSTVAW